MINTCLCFIRYHNNEDEMSKNKSIIDTEVNVCNTVYIITVADVTNAVTHLKTSKSDGSEGLKSDHFINGTTTLLFSPSRIGFSVLISECEKFTAEYDILFNGNKSKLMYFKGTHHLFGEQQKNVSNLPLAAFGDILTYLCLPFPVAYYKN